MGRFPRAAAAAALTKVTRVLLPAGYQGYKRHCRRGGAEDNGDALSLGDNSAKAKDLAVENGVFEYDDGTTEEKKKDKFSSHL